MQRCPPWARGAAALLLSIPASLYFTVAYAQRAGENAVAEANDAFGTTVGREEIGLYTATSARGLTVVSSGQLTSFKSRRLDLSLAFDI